MSLRARGCPRFVGRATRCARVGRPIRSGMGDSMIQLPLDRCFPTTRVHRIIVWPALRRTGHSPICLRTPRQRHVSLCHHKTCGLGRNVAGLLSNFPGCAKAASSPISARPLTACTDCQRWQHPFRDMGNTLTGSYDDIAEGAYDVMSAWASEHQRALGQPTSPKSAGDRGRDGK